MRSALAVTGFWYFERVESGDGWLMGWGDRGAIVTKRSSNDFLLRLIWLTVSVFLRIMAGYLERFCLSFLWGVYTEIFCLIIVICFRKFAESI